MMTWAGRSSLLALDGRRSPHVAAVIEPLRDVAEVTIERVSYEFPRGGRGVGVEG